MEGAQLQNYPANFRYLTLAFADPSAGLEAAPPPPRRPCPLTARPALAAPPKPADAAYWAYRSIPEQIEVYSLF